MNNANSREHFYSEWMHDLLPYGRQGTYTGEIIVEHPKTRAVSRHDKRLKPGNLYNKKMKVVCQTCNNEWMSRIENAVKPLLTPIIDGDEITLDAAQLESVAKWATLKALVCEHDNRGTAVTPQADRAAFMGRGLIPAYFNIYLLNHNCGSRVGYVRTSQTISMTNGDPVPPLECRTKNTQQISVILGSAMLHINAARVDGFSIENNLNMPAVIGRRIWPPNVTSLTWPGDPFLSCDQMRDLAYAMDHVMALPRANWGGDLPTVAGK